MSAHPQARLTPEQYLEIERAAEFRSEYYNSRMYAMAGRSKGTSMQARRKRPKGSRCRERALHLPGPGSGLRGAEIRERWTNLLNPTLITEVLSPSTEAYDRGFKFAQYRMLESLQEYVLVSQSQPQVEIFRRQPNGEWLLSVTAGLEATCRFDNAGCAVALAEIYDKITFTPEELRPSEV
jgi:Uma2 family endonuclease